MSNNQKFEQLIQAVEKAQASVDAAQAKLEDAVKDLPHGHVIQIGGVPYQVSEIKGKKVVRSMVSKRVAAALKGEPVPELRVRRRKAEIAPAAQ